MNQNLKDHLLSAGAGAALGGISFGGAVLGILAAGGALLLTGSIHAAITIPLGLAGSVACGFVVAGTIKKKTAMFRPVSAALGLVAACVGGSALLVAGLRSPGTPFVPLPERTYLTEKFAGACKDIRAEKRDRSVLLILPEGCAVKKEPWF